MTPNDFHELMINYLDEYQEYLLLVKSNGSAISHCTIIHQFINYLYNYHLISNVDQITISMTNSKFLADFKRRNKESVAKDSMKVILKGFFDFLYGKYGIKNERLMKGVKSLLDSD